MKEADSTSSVTGVWRAYGRELASWWHRLGEYPLRDLLHAVRELGGPDAGVRRDVDDLVAGGGPDGALLTDLSDLRSIDLAPLLDDCVGVPGLDDAAGQLAVLKVDLDVAGAFLLKHASSS